VVAALALLALRGVMIYSVRVETYLPALACLTLAATLAVDRPVRPLLLALVLALAVLYHQTNVLFILPLLVLLIPADRDSGRAGELAVLIALAGAGLLVSAAYLAGYQHDQPSGGLWDFALSYARAPVAAWGSFTYFSPSGVQALAVSQLKMVLPVRAGAAWFGGPLMIGTLVFLFAWHGARIWRRAPQMRLRLFALVFLTVYLPFFLWWMPTDMDFFLATLLPVWLLGLLLIGDLPPQVRSLPVGGILVLVLTAGNLVFTIWPMHRDPGPGRKLALALDRAAPAGAEMIAGYSVQQEMLYFTTRTRVHEVEGLARAVSAGEDPWDRDGTGGPAVVITGPCLRSLLGRDDTSTRLFLTWLLEYDPAEASGRNPRALAGADGFELGPDRVSFASLPEMVSRLRELAGP
jgi:hypothetical protein